MAVLCEYFDEQPGVIKSEELSNWVRNFSHLKKYSVAKGLAESNGRYAVYIFSKWKCSSPQDGEILF